jgi:hypothetical protein
MMMIVIFVSILRTFELLRIFSVFSPVTLMIFTVIVKLRFFLLFFLIFVVGCSMIISLFELNVTLFKYNQPISNIMMSLFTAFGKAQLLIKKSWVLEKKENFLFWLCWLMMVVAMNIVLLKFVIAEIKGVYKIVSKRLNENIQKDRAGLCAEADIIRPNYFKTKHTFPKYFIVREIST